MGTEMAEQSGDPGFVERRKHPRTVFGSAPSYEGALGSLAGDVQRGNRSPIKGVVSPANPSAQATTWALLAPFLNSESDRWLHSYLDETQFRFAALPSLKTEENWHHRNRDRSGLRDWKAYLRDSHRAFRPDIDGIITVFPQLAVTAGLEKRLRRSSVPVLAWFFNAEIAEQWRYNVAARALSRVNSFVVHTTEECRVYPTRFGLPAERFHFAHLQYGGRISTVEEEGEQPFVFSTGSGYRDYGTFFAALAKLGYPAKVLAGPRVLRGLQPPPNVTILDQIPKSQIHDLVRAARVNVLPLSDEGVCAGGVTVVEAFRHGRALVATERRGGEDYLIDNQNCLTSALCDVDELAERIEAMWVDATLRERLNAGALAFGLEHCTDEVASNTLRGHLEALS